MIEHGSSDALTIEHADIPFGEGPGLRDISLVIGGSERVVLLAPSGAGKTTLLRAIAGLSPVTAGRIDVAGLDVTRLPAERRRAVYLHQTPMLFPHLSVAENIAFPIRLQRVSPDRVLSRVNGLLDQVQLRELATRHPHSLSGGQRHRVALARAIAANPHLLLLDEPLASLDPVLRSDIRSAMMSLQRAAGAAMLLATHDLDDAAGLGDRVAVLLGGAVVQVAVPRVLFRKPASLAIARFLGTCVLIPGEVAEGCFVSALGRLGTPDARVDGQVVAAIPPDAFRIVAREVSGAVPAVVCERHEHPRHTSVRLAVGSESVEVAASNPVPIVGETVGLAVDASEIHLLQGPIDA